MVKSTAVSALIDWPLLRRRKILKVAGTGWNIRGDVGLKSKAFYKQDTQMKCSCFSGQLPDRAPKV